MIAGWVVIGMTMMLLAILFIIMYWLSTCCYSDRDSDSMV
jgi:hypothetical protein